KASAPDKFLVPQIHGDAVFLFNKQNAISIPSFDAEAFIRGLLDRRKRLVERMRSEEHTSELQSRFDLVCRLLLEKKKKTRSKRYLIKQKNTKISIAFYISNIMGS